MSSIGRIPLMIGSVIAVLSCQGCILAAAGAAGAAGGYEAKKHGYEVQSPVQRDAAGGYKGQNPVVHDPARDETSRPANNTMPAQAPAAGG